MVGAKLTVLNDATGLRIGEGLGIEIDEHISPDFMTLYIRQKVHGGKSNTDQERQRLS